MAGINQIKSNLQKVSIGEWGGKERTLLFDMNAFSILEEKFGTIDAAFKALSSGAIKSIRTLLWCGLTHDETFYDIMTGDVLSYGITIPEVGSWFNMRDLEMLGVKIEEAIVAGLPEVTQEEIAKAKAEAEATLKGTGIVVGNSEVTITYTEEELKEIAAEEEIKKD